MAKQYAKEQEKQNEPVYANMNEDGNLVHFTIDNGISIDKFYELNPDVKIKAGQSYCVK